MRRGPSFLLALGVLSALLLRFGPYFENQGFDFVQHYLLVDEIMKHGAVRPGQYAHIGAMAVYPPGAHWLTAIVGWMIGSGIAAMTLITVASMYACYLLAALLLERTAAIILFGGAVLALAFTKSLLGYEMVVNYFYPQLVADVLYLGILLWGSRAMPMAQRSAAFVLAAIVAMWVQPIVALHILAAACVMCAIAALDDYKQLVALAATTVASLAVVVLHPAFRVMRTIASNDGWLVFGYGHIIAVAVLCGAVGAVNIWRSRNSTVDLMIGAAAIGGALLTLLQFAAWKLQFGGSPYAVKKHMFLVLTFGIMSAIRLVTKRMPSIRWRGATAAVVAGVCAYRALMVFDFPLAPIVTALARAQHAADYQIPGAAPGDVAFYDPSLPLMVSVAISLTAFQHPFDARAIKWQEGGSMLDGVKLVMVPRTPDVLAKCQARAAESREYVIVDPACLRQGMR